MSTDEFFQHHAVDLHVPAFCDLKAVVSFGYFAHSKPGPPGFEIHQDRGGGQAIDHGDGAKGVGQGEADIVGIIHTKIAAPEGEGRPARERDPGVSV